MSDKIKEFFKEINNGIYYGSQSKLARDINTQTSLACDYANGKSKPSENHVKKMAALYKKSEDEIKDIFSIREKCRVYQYASNIGGSNEQIFNPQADDFFAERLKSIELKLDLILARIK
jgi:transcriptional regulator with XRE-family HTH domain